MKKITLLLVTIIFSVNGFSQVMFQKKYNSGFFNVGHSVQQTNDGGYAVAGRTSSGSGGGDGYMVKTDLNDSLQWAQTFGGMRQENILSIRQTADGGYILAGSSMSFSIDSLNHLYMARLNSAGVLLWDKTYGPATGNQDIGLRFVRQTTDGGFITGGYDSGPYGLIYMKTDSSGNASWIKHIDGMIGTYGLNSIQQTSDGGYIIAGNGNLLTKTDASGNVTWCKSYLTGNTLIIYAQQTSDSGYFIVGSTNSFGSGGFDGYFIKTNSTGDTLWCKTYGGVGNDVVYSARQTADGGYILVGNTESFGAGAEDVYLVKTDSNGNLMWSYAYGDSGTDAGYDVEQTADGGYIITGYSGSDLYLIKTNVSGISGCNETYSLTLVTSPSLPTATVLTSSNPITEDTFSPSANAGSGCSVTTICFSVPTSMAENNNADNYFIVSPNPTFGELIIDNGEWRIEGVIIYNALGEKVFKSQISSLKSQISVDVSQLLPGVYFVAATDDKGNRVTKRLVKM